MDKNGTSTNVLVTTGFHRHIISSHSICDNTWLSIKTAKDDKEPINFFCNITGTLVGAALGYDVMVIFIH